MLFFIVVCIFLLVAIPLLQNSLKKTGQSGPGSNSGDVSNDPNFYTSSASERYGEPLASAASDSSDANSCTDSDSGSGSGSDSDSGSCDSDSGGSDGGSSD